MKTKTLIIILMLLSASEVLAQSRIWEMPTTPADTTIVREWREGKYIVYSRQGSNQTVSYHDNLSPTIRSAQIPPFVIINDFRIFGDMVYAGGKIPGTPFSHGLLASFSIHDLMGASGTFYVMTFIINNIGFSTCQDFTFPDCHVSGIKRIFPFQSGSATCVAYIADDSIVGSGSSGIGCRRVGYGDALFSGLAWSIDTFHYNKDAFNLFSDLTATDNYIALVSRDCYYNRLEFVVHDKGANYANLPPTPGSDIYFFTDHKVTGKVMSTALEEDIFEKIALFCNLKKECVIENRTIPLLYEVPLMLEKQGMADTVCEKLKLGKRKPDLKDWKQMVRNARHPSHKVNIAIVGKYVKLHDAYLSIAEALAQTA